MQTRLLIKFYKSVGPILFMSYNSPDDRTLRINGSFQIAGQKAVFVQDVDFTPNAEVFDRDYIGAGQSVFSQNGDVVGSFTFSLKNTISLYDPASTPTIENSVSKWMIDIANYEPPIISFVQTLKQKKDPSAARISFKGRIMNCKLGTNVGSALQDVVVTGEITELTSVTRLASAGATGDDDGATGEMEAKPQTS